MSQFIPGTAIPLDPPGAAAQTEGRGSVHITRDREPPSLLERIEDPAALTPSERSFVAAALRAYDRTPKLERSVFAKTSAQTDGTTGNVVIPLFEVPQGYEGHLTYVVADAPGTAAITPTAPSANAAIWNYLAILPGSGGRANADAATSGGTRTGLVDFQPNPALSTGAALPVRYSYNDSNAPIAWGGQTIWFVFIGGSQAGVKNITVQVSYRVNLYQHGLLP